MAQKRMIDKKISVNEKVADMSIAAQLLFTWMIIHADDLGLLPYSPRTIKAMVIPMSKVSLESVGFHLETMLKAGLIEVFEWKKEKFYRIVKFSDNQTLKKDRKPQTIASGIDDWKTVETIWKKVESQEKRTEEKRSKESVREESTREEGVSAEDSGAGYTKAKEIRNKLPISKV